MNDWEVDVPGGIADARGWSRGVEINRELTSAHSSVAVVQPDAVHVNWQLLPTMSALNFYRQKCTSMVILQRIINDKTIWLKQTILVVNAEV